VQDAVGADGAPQNLLAHTTIHCAVQSTNAEEKLTEHRRTKEVESNRSGKAHGVPQRQAQ